MEMTPALKQFYKKLEKSELFQIFDSIRLTELGIVIEFQDMAVLISDNDDVYNPFRVIIANSPNPDEPSVLYIRTEAKLYVWLQMVAASMVSNKIKRLAKDGEKAS